MKVYVHYEEEEEDKALTLKLTLPKKWLGQPLLQVLELFVESYNQKKADLPPLDVAGVHFEKAGYVGLLCVWDVAQLSGAASSISGHPSPPHPPT